MIDEVVIVGGGTAGWMAATYLQAAFGDELSITVVESQRVGSIGVGEATFSTIRYFFEYLGLDEEHWMPQCGASYKLGIKFVDWRSPGSHFYHPFERLRKVNGFSIADWWLQFDGKVHDFDSSVFVTPSLCEAMRSPRFFDGSLFTTQIADHTQHMTLEDQRDQFPYAYHFDADLLAKFLMRFGVARGITHMVDDVVGVNQDTRGWITEILTKDHGPIATQLVVDCTGFRGLLINKTLGEPFNSFRDMLPNNRAVALRVPNDPECSAIAPYTTATAADAGWIWTIPLFGRIGTGYVYSDSFCTPENAETTLRAFAADGNDDLAANHIQMRIGRCRNSWVKNCVAIGLSSGFVEPLESTGIFFIQHGIEQLVKHFPNPDWSQSLIDSYNNRVAEVIDGVKEFLVFHYRAAARTDNDYWKATKSRDIPDALHERLRLWEEMLPDARSIYQHYHGFEPYSWQAMAVGLGNGPRHPRAAVTRMNPASARQELNRIQSVAANLINTLPSAHEYLSRLNGLAIAGGEEPARRIGLSVIGSGVGLQTPTRWP
jgi:flavin-dependent dehydrogenase